MTEAERQFAMTQLVEGRDSLLRAIEGLSEAQMSFKPEPDGWSIADCLEHLAITEDALFELIARGAPNPAGVPLPPEKDGRMVAAIVNRGRKVGAPKAMQPAGHFASPAEARTHFLASRERAIAYATTSTVDLRALFTIHPLLGEIDCYRCLLLLALHPARHAAQIEEIKRHVNFDGGKLPD